MNIILETVDRYTRRIPKQGNMKVPVTIYMDEGTPVEEEAIQQIVDAACIDDEAIIIATPDIHTGYGIPIGSILASPNYISPSAVGYDINCGMRLLSTPFNRKDINPDILADEISRLIPLGEGKNNLKISKKELEAILSRGLKQFIPLARRFKLIENPEESDGLERDIHRVEDEGSLDGSPEALTDRALERGLPQLGTLGGGNHFIEIQEVVSIENSERAEQVGISAGQLTIMIHSGSRGLGHETAGFYMKRAREHMTAHHLHPPNTQLLFFQADSSDGRDYLKAMNGASNFAFANRQVMCLLVRKAVKKIFGTESASRIHTVYDVTHNVAKVEKHYEKEFYVHRKGATRAFDAARMKGTPFEDIGQPVLIPGSMGTASYILLGFPGSERSLFSVNHGAGRLLSRSKAAGKKGRPGMISDKNFSASMEGIYLICGNKRRIKEEAPAAYKDIDRVIQVVVGAGLALPVAKLMPLAVLKG